MKVLVADDSPVLVRALAKLLDQAGYDVVVANDGLEAIQKFYEEVPDLVLLDINMPKLHGYVVCRLLKEDPSARSVPILILTARSSNEDRYWATRSGADGFLTKEAMGEELLDSVQSALASRALADLSRIEPPSQTLEESDVLARVCEVLDRKLFEASIVNDIVAIGVRADDLHGTINESLSILGRLVECDAAGVLLHLEHELVLRANTLMSIGDFEVFRDLAALRGRQFTTVDVRGEDLSLILPTGVDTSEILDTTGATSDGGWESFESIPLWSKGEVVALLVLASHDKDAFSDNARRNLRTIEPHLATVIDSAKQYQRILEQEARSSLSSLLD